MKKLFILCLSLLLLMSACAKKEEEVPQTDTGMYLIMVNTDGMGSIAVTEGEGDPQFDSEFPTQSFGTYVAEGSKMTLAARADEDSMFVKWTKDGSTCSNEPQITVTVNEDCEYIAVFSMSNNYDGPTAEKIEDIKTIGDVLGLPFFGYTALEDRLIYAFELDDVVYRAVAPLDQETYEAIFDLDFFDPQYHEKFNGLMEPIAVEKIENVTAAIPSQKDLDQYVGKSGEDLINEGWSIHSFNIEENAYGMSHGLFDYLVRFEGEVLGNEDLDEEVIRPLKVASVTYERLGDVADPFTELD